MKEHTFTLGVLLVAGCLLVLTSCATVNISRLVNNPAKYQNRTVRVAGTVTTSYGVPFVGGVYQVQDDTGKIYVLSSRGGVPTKGARVNVAGRLTNGVTIAGHSYGTVIREEKTHVQ